MKIDDIITSFVNQGSDHKRSVGIYWASEVNQIIKGYLKPENFFDRGKIDLDGAKMISSGIAMENMLTKIFEKTGVECQTQVRKEIEIARGIKLIVKPDYIFKNFVLETKFPFRPFDEIPTRYQFQLECEYRSCFLPVYLGVFSNPFNVRLLSFTPSKARWRKITNFLIEFDKELRKFMEGKVWAEEQTGEEIRQEEEAKEEKMKEPSITIPEGEIPKP